MPAGTNKTRNLINIICIRVNHLAAVSQPTAANQLSKLYCLFSQEFVNRTIHALLHALIHLIQLIELKPQILNVRFDVPRQLQFFQSRPNRSYPKWCYRQSIHM